MIKIETHCHCVGAGVCPLVTAEQIIADYTANGYGGVIMANHYSEGAFCTFPDGDDKVKAEYFLSLVDNLKRLGEKDGFKVFYGAEIRLNCDGQEYMLIGFDRRFFLDYPSLYKCTQKELFEIADASGVFMSQSHPFRNGVVSGDPRYLHGAEAFNGHFHHFNNNDKADKFCSENGLIKLSGTDYHRFHQPITGGIYIPEYITDECALVKYLFENNFQRIENEEFYVRTRDKYFEEKNKCK